MRPLLIVLASPSFNPDAPVALWGQPPPRRAVTVRAGGKAGLPGAVILRVEGPGGRREAGASGGTSPRLRVALLRVERMEGGIVTDAISDSSGAPITLELEPTEPGDHLVWECRMALPSDVVARFALEIEETETLLTTEAAAGATSSAPRFSAFVEVPS